MENKSLLSGTEKAQSNSRILNEEESVIQSVTFGGSIVKPKSANPPPPTSKVTPETSS